MIYRFLLRVRRLRMFAYQLPEAAAVPDPGVSHIDGGLFDM